MEKTASELFDTLSLELRDLAEQTTALQDQFSDRGYNDIDIEAVQNLDSLNQTLASLATYVAHLSAIAPCTCTVPIDEAVDQVCLTALAERLRGDTRSSAHRAATEVELF